MYDEIYDETYGVIYEVVMKNNIQTSLSETWKLVNIYFHWQVPLAELHVFSWFT
jgi:hypothetical protein